MSTEVSVSTTINALPETTWSAIERIDAHVNWMADAEAITFTTSQHAGVGTTFNCRTRIGPIRFTDVLSVTEWVPGEAMGVEHRGVVRGSGVFTLRACGGGCTRFSWDEQLTFPWWLGARIGERVARPLLARVWRGNLARLKQIAEALPQNCAGGPSDATRSA